VIGVLAIAVRRLGRFPSSVSGPVRVIGGINVGQRERIIVVRAGGRQLVLGVTPSSINTLLVSDEDEGSSADPVREYQNPEGFKTQLHNALERLIGR